MQEHFRPSQGMIQQINQIAATMPAAATLFTQRDEVVPLSKLGKTGPMNDQLVVNISKSFSKHGYNLPDELILWLRSQNADEVVVVGGHNDANVLAAGFSLFQHGFKPALVPVLCYGNEWYMHSVTTGLWRDNLGPVYESVAELKFAAL